MRKKIILLLLVIMSFGFTEGKDIPFEYDEEFYEKLGEYIESDNLRYLCVYGDQDSELEEEKEAIYFEADYKSENADWAGFLYKGVSITAAETMDEWDPEHDDLTSDNCPEIAYYKCYYDELKTSNKYSGYVSHYIVENDTLRVRPYANTVNDCYVSFNRPIKDSDTIFGEEFPFPKKSISGTWSLNKNPNITLPGVLTTYVSLTNNNKIYIRKQNDDELNIKLNKEDIEVPNSKNYSSTFINKDKDKYPIYLIEKNDSSYEFIESLNNQSEEIKNRKEVYVNVNYLNRIHGLGDEEIYKTCSDIFGETFLIFINNTVIKAIQIGVPILLIILTIVDFAKVVFIDDKEGIQNAVRRFKKRGIAALLIFLTPYILIWIIKIVAGPQSVESCIKTINNLAEESETSK